MKSYNEGLGQYVHVEIVSSHSVEDFNTQLAWKLDDGWQVVQGVQVTKIGRATQNVNYTCMIAKKRTV